MCTERRLFSGLVLREPAFQYGDGGQEVVAERDEQVDVVEVFGAGEAVGEVVAWVDGGEHFTALGAEEAIMAIAFFARGPVTSEGGDRDGHGQVVADFSEQVGVLLPVRLHEDAVGDDGIGDARWKTLSAQVAEVFEGSSLSLFGLARIVADPPMRRVESLFRISPGMGWHCMLSP